MSVKAKYTKEFLASFEPKKFEEMEKYADLLVENNREFIRNAVSERVERLKQTLGELLKDSKAE